MTDAEVLNSLTQQLVMWTAIMAVATCATVVSTTAVAIYAAKGSRTAVAISERDERRAFGAMVQGYFERRREDLFRGTNTNMPHYVHELEGMIASMDYPNGDRLLTWLTDAMDSINSYEAVDSDRGMNAHILRMELPGVIGEWVRNPKGFAPNPYRRWEEIRADEETRG